MKIRKWFLLTLFALIGLALAMLIVWGWRQGGAVLLQLRGLC